MKKQVIAGLMALSSLAASVGIVLAQTTTPRPTTTPAPTPTTVVPTGAPQTGAGGTN